MYAADTLGSFGPQAATPAVLDALATTARDPLSPLRIKSGAIASWLRIEPGKALPELLAIATETLCDPASPEEMLQYVFELAEEVGAPAATRNILDAIENYLTDSSAAEKIRIAAARAAGAIGLDNITPGILAAMKKIIRDPDDKVALKRFVWRELRFGFSLTEETGHLCDYAFQVLCDPSSSEETRIQILYLIHEFAGYMGRVKPQIFDILAGILANPKASIDLTNAAFTVAMFGARQANTAFTVALADIISGRSGAEEIMRCRASRIMGRIGAPAGFNEAVLAAMVTMLNEPSEYDILRQTALETLKEISPSRWTPELLDALSKCDPMATWGILKSIVEWRWFWCKGRSVRRTSIEDLCSLTQDQVQTRQQQHEVEDRHFILGWTDYHSALRLLGIDDAECKEEGIKQCRALVGIDDISQPEDCADQKTGERLKFLVEQIKTESLRSMRIPLIDLAAMATGMWRFAARVHEEFWASTAVRRPDGWHPWWQPRMMVAETSVTAWAEFLLSVGYRDGQASSPRSRSKSPHPDETPEMLVDTLRFLGQLGGADLTPEIHEIVEASALAWNPLSELAFCTYDDDDNASGSGQAEWQGLVFSDNDEGRHWPVGWDIECGPTSPALVAWRTIWLSGEPSIPWKIVPILCACLRDPRPDRKLFACDLILSTNPPEVEILDALEETACVIPLNDPVFHRVLDCLGRAFARNPKRQLTEVLTTRLMECVRGGDEPIAAMARTLIAASNNGGLGRLAGIV